jgi:indole-3-glycerol phosphate synthase
MPQSGGTILDEIIAARRDCIRKAKMRMPLIMLKEALRTRPPLRDFAAALSGPSLRVIAEMKRASPSHGMLRQDYHCREIAQSYEANGAAALSVLTEEDFFRGSLTDLIDARDAVGLPVLRKDFIIEPYQIYESAAAGADAALLIVAVLDDEELGVMLELSRTLSIAALVEVHTEDELVRAVKAGAQIIGVNNRNLKNLSVDLETSVMLRSKIPAGVMTVSESGIKTPADVRRLSDAGYNAVLIGERFLTGPDPGRELAQLLEDARVSNSPRT